MSKSTAIIFIMGFALLFKLEKKVGPYLFMSFSLFILIIFCCVYYYNFFAICKFLALDSLGGCGYDIWGSCYVYLSGMTI